MRILILLAAAAMMFAGCSSRHPVKELQAELESYIASRPCRIGVAVICGEDTVAVNGTEPFAMMSVFKFPQALALADFCERNSIALADSIAIDSSAILTDTYSPMRDRYGAKSMRLSIAELLEYSLVMSDNNACDILFALIGSPAYADSVVKSLGFNDIHIRHSEADMHADTTLCAANSATPLQMAALFEHFRTRLSETSASMATVRQNLELCSTGAARIPAAQFEPGTIIGHKTGTGDISPQGRITALNDAGYIELPNGTAYSIAIFVADSPLPLPDTEAIIAQISDIVRAAFAPASGDSL